MTMKHAKMRFRRNKRYRRCHRSMIEVPVAEE
jgi:hypothetical protein